MNIKEVLQSPGNPKSFFWSFFRVVYFVDMIFWVAVFSVCLCPPKDGDEAFEAEIKGARPPLRGFTLSKAAWPWREGETAVVAR